MENNPSVTPTKSALSKSPVTPYFSIAILTIATFMEVLDTTIANVAIPRIAADLAVPVADATWVLGSYLVANAAILPISGWLATRFGRKRYFMACIALFVLSSVLCGLSTNLETLVFFRVIQGLSGGGLAPSEQAIIADSVPPEKLGRAFSIYATCIFFAPIIGPTVGGFITDNLSWHWIFFINLPVGIISLILVYLFVHESEETLKTAAAERLKNSSIDWIGIILFVGGIACLELVLEQGPKEGWFESNLIIAGAIAAFFALLIGATWEWYRKNPAVDIEMFKHRHFASACVLLFFVGFVFYGSVFLIPYLAQTLLDYTATNAGLVLLPGAIVSLIMMPVVGYLVDATDARRIIFFGFLISIVIMWYLCSLNLNISFGDLAMMRALQTFGFSFLVASINTVAYYNLPAGKNNSASALLNLVRNVGASLGFAATGTLLLQRTQVHINNLSYHASNYNPNFTEAVGNLTRTLKQQGLTALEARNLSYDALWEMLVKQASMKAVIDAFQTFLIVLIFVAPLVFLLKAKRSNDSSGGH